MKKFVSLCVFWSAFAVAGLAQTTAAYLPCVVTSVGVPCTRFNDLTIDGVTPATFAFIDPSSSIQGQFAALQAEFNGYATNTNPFFSGIPTTGVRTTCNDNPNEIVTEGYVNVCAPGGASAVGYPSPTLYKIPFVNSTTPSTTLADSPLAFNPGTDSVQTSYYLEALPGTGMQIDSNAASSSGNQSNVGFTDYLAYWNGVANITDPVSYGNDVCPSYASCGATPAAYAQISGPLSIPLTGLELTSNDPGGSLNVPPPAWLSQGFYDNAGTPGLETVAITPSQGSGSQPNVTITHSCTGSTGTCTDVFSQIKTTGGAPGYDNNGAREYGGATSLPGSCNTGDTVELTNAAYSNAAHETCWNGTWVADGPDMVGTPTFTNDSGAGTSPTVSFVAGAQDKRGWINIKPDTSPASAAGVVTVVFNTANVYPSAPVVHVFPSNPATVAVFAADGIIVPQNTASAASFVIYATTALVAGTQYQFGWESSVR